MNKDGLNLPIRVTAVLPLKIHTQEFTSDLDRLRYILLPSFIKYWIDKESIEFLVIVPSNEIKLAKRKLKNFSSFRFRFLTDDDLCPRLQSKMGWYKQQILKLYAAKVVETQYFLTLDADLILIKPVTLKDFFQNSKPIFQQEQASVHWDWWTSSRNVLKSRIELNKDMKMIGVTPEFLSRDICLELIDEIAKRNNVLDAGEFLFSVAQTEKWTEYTLYWLFVMEKGLEKSLYFWSEKLLYKGIWIRKDFNAPIIKSLIELFHQQEAFFVVIQSTMHINPRGIAALLDSDSVSSKIKFHFFAFKTNLTIFVYKLIRKVKKLIIHK